MQSISHESERDQMIEKSVNIHTEVQAISHLPQLFSTSNLAKKSFTERELVDDLRRTYCVTN